MLPNRNALAPRNDPQEDDAQEDAVDTRSKTRRKRDAEALQALGERLVELKPSRLAVVTADMPSSAYMPQNSISGLLWM